MENPQYKYVYAIVALIAVVSLVYFGSQGITASVAKEVVNQCEDPDGLDAYTGGICKDNLGWHRDGCSHLGAAADEYYCLDRDVCNKYLVACNEGDECKLIDGVGRCVAA